MTGPPVDVLANTTDGNGSRIISPTATTTYTLNGTDCSMNPRDHRGRRAAVINDPPPPTRPFPLHYHEPELVGHQRHACEIDNGLGTTTHLRKYRRQPVGRHHLYAKRYQFPRDRNRPSHDRGIRH